MLAPIYCTHSFSRTLNIFFRKAFNRFWSELEPESTRSRKMSENKNNMSKEWSFAQNLSEIHLL